MREKLEFPLWISVLSVVGAIAVAYAAGRGMLTYVWSPADGIKGAGICLMVALLAAGIFYHLARVGLLILSILLVGNR